MIRSVQLGCILLLATATASLAGAPVPPERPRDAAPEAAAAPPFQAKLERLAALLGTLAFLRDLCAAGDGPAWRDKMSDLLSAEGSTPLRRDRLAGAFNRGFDDYRLTYRVCTPAAEVIIDRTLAEGAAITRDLASRFGN